MKYHFDLELSKKIAAGNPDAWREFVDIYTDYILALISRWCNRTCQLISANKECEVKKIKSGQKSLSGNSCDEGIALYEYTFRVMKNKVPKYQGKSSLKTFITACFKNICHDFLIEKYGKIVIPNSLKDLSSGDQRIYKVICRSSSLENVAEKLELPEEEIKQAYQRIFQKLKAEGKVWQHLLGKFAKNSPVLELEHFSTEEEKEIPLNAHFLDNNHEIREVFSKALWQIPAKQKRLLELRFGKNLEARVIFNNFADFFGWKKESEFYPDLEKAVKSLASKIISHYSEENPVANPDLKEFKDSLRDFFQLTNQ